MVKKEQTKTNAWQVPLAGVDLGGAEIAAIAEVLEDGWLSQGPRVERFEAEFAEYIGVSQAVAVSSGTAALHLACLDLDLGPGDEVLCPALTFVATANAIRYTGATPCFVDIAGHLDLNISPQDAEQKISPKTKAIMVVHYGGFAADIQTIRELAARHGLFIIEDCAHAPGAYYRLAKERRRVGSLGTVACFSFFANKNMTTGEGGMMVTDDVELAQRLRSARSHGMTSLTWDRHRGHNFSYDVAAPGYNYRLDEMRAALGMVQLSRLEGFNARRRELSGLYRQLLSGKTPVEMPFPVGIEDSCCHLFPVLLPEPSQRPKFMDFLKQHGIQTSIHYPPVHGFTYYQRLWPAGFDHRLSRTEEVSARLVTLPLYASMSQEQLEQVVQAVQRFFGSS